MSDVFDHDSHGLTVPKAVPAVGGDPDLGSLRDVDPARWVATGETSDLPGWLSASVADGEIVTSERRFDVELTERTSRFGRVRSAAVHGAGRLDDDAFEDAVARAYEAALDGLDSARLLRAWNFVPGINDPASISGDGLDRDRYMVFNAGRFRAFAEAFGNLEWFPVASGVGHAGDTMVVHLLHGDATVAPVDNPRQIRPESYSRRFGHPTPAFARAGRVRWGGEEALLVSGTASVVGEASRHTEDLEAQIEETLSNLEIVVERGWPGAVPTDLEDWLVYLPDPEDEALVRRLVAGRWPDGRPRIVFRGQRLCRPELRVEIECAGFRGVTDGVVS